MTEFFNLDTSFFEKTFPSHDGMSRENHLDASEVLAAALEQMDGIIASTNEPQTNFDQHTLCTSPNSLHTEKSPSEFSPILKVKDCISTHENPLTVNNILDLLKDFILSRSNANDNFVPNRDFNISAAKVVFTWLHRQLKNHSMDIEVPVNPEDIEGFQKVQDLESDKKALLLQASVLADQVDVQGDKIMELEKILQQKKDKLLHLEQSLQQEVLGRSTVENSKLELLTELTNLRRHLTASERERKETDDKCKKLEHELALCQARLNEKEAEHAKLKDKLSKCEDHMATSGSLEMEKLRLALDAAIASTDKDQKIEDLQLSVSRYRKLQGIIASSHNHLKRATSGSDSHIFNHEPVLCSTNSDALKAFPVKNQYGTIPRQTGPQVLQQLQTHLQEYESEQKKTDSAPSEMPKNPPQENALTSSKSRNTNGANNLKSSGVSFAPECVTIPVETNNVEHSPDYSTVSPQHLFTKSDKDKNKGILKFFSKQDFVLFKRWKRAGSQSIDRLEGDFKRGGIRSTAGPRLGWSREIKIDPDIPFVNWTTDMIIDWLHKLGMSMYVTDCKRWMCNGEILTKATSQDFEKELNMKHPLHKKKLLLAIKSVNNNLLNMPSSINDIDCEWVFRWLDDVGLPQYKDAFAESLVDGRMLHTLTVDDLLYLKVTSQLHHISIKCGIQVLREKGFEPHCLVRRSLPEESKPGYRATPEKVALWTNHRVMEWLRTVDLSEFAPNLRGSGVHGALVVYEPKFNTNLFATLLNIPPSKTLLRRHLATHFKHIVGEDLMQTKREKETEVPLSPSVKIKIGKKSQFALKKKRNKIDFDNEEFVCPMDIAVCHDQVSQSAKIDGDKLVVRRNSDPSPQDRHLDLKTILQGDNLNSSPSTVV